MAIIGNIPYFQTNPPSVPRASKYLEICQVDPAIFVNLAELCFKEHQQCILAHAPAALDFSAALASPKTTVDAATWVQLLHWALTTDTEREAVVRILSCCFFLRSARHCADVQEITNEEVYLTQGGLVGYLLLMITLLGLGMMTFRICVSKGEYPYLVLNLWGASWHGKET